MNLEDIVELTELANYNLGRSKTGTSNLYKIIEKLNSVAIKLDNDKQQKYENILEMADSKILEGNHPHLSEAVNHYYYSKEQAKQYNTGKTM